MLREELIRYAELMGGQCAFVVKDLKTDQAFTYNEQLVVPSASLIKVPVMLEAFHRFHSGSLDPQQRLTVKAEEKVAFSVLEFLDHDNSYTVLDLIRLMIIYSDNTAANILIDLLGMEHINRRVRDLGLTETCLRRKMMDFSARKEGRENITTASEMAEIMIRLYHGNLMGKPYDTQIFEIMKGQADECMMRVDLPDEIVIARKSGELENLNHEMAVVYGSSCDYLYVFFVWDTKSNNISRQILQKTSKIVYDYFEI